MTTKKISMFYKDPTPWSEKPLGKPGDIWAGLLRTGKYAGLGASKVSIELLRIATTGKEPGPLEKKIEGKMLEVRIPNTKLGAFGSKITIGTIETTLAAAAVGFALLVLNM